MNTEAIRLVAKELLAQNTILPNGERLQFDMKNWCGTTCCIAGWTNILIPDDETAAEGEHDLFSAKRKLGLTREQALALFSPALNIRYSEVNSTAGSGSPLAPCGHRQSGLGETEEPARPARSQGTGPRRLPPRKS